MDNKSYPCVHCRDLFKSWTCETCKKEIDAECKECHNELKHDSIVIQNIHIIGGRGGVESTIGNDPDMYGHAGFAGND